MEESGHLRGQSRVLRGLKLRVVLHQTRCLFAGQVQQRTVSQVGHTQLRQTALPGPKEVSRPPQFQVNLRQFEPVVNPLEGRQPLLGGLRLGVGEEQTVAPVFPAAHPAAKLVKLGQAEPVGGFRSA